MGPNPSRPIRPSFGVPKKKKPTGGMASPGSGRNRKKLTPKKPNIRKVTGPRKLTNLTWHKLQVRKKLKAAWLLLDQAKYKEAQQLMPKKNNSAVAVNKKKKPGS